MFPDHLKDVVLRIFAEQHGNLAERNMLALLGRVELLTCEKLLGCSTLAQKLIVGCFSANARKFLFQIKRLRSSLGKKALKLFLKIKQIVGLELATVEEVS